jgi:D-glycero-D-manno-heptose 1,7-bisphosphate phosphatase
VNPQEAGIFFDRDGTINVDLDYISDPEKLQLIPGAVEAIKEANALGVRVFVITNQSGVARGLYSEKDVRAVHSRLRKVLKRSGAHIDAIFYCPHHPDYGLPPYRKVCTCRKPSTGMLKEAERSFGIDLKASFVVGDKCTDIETGRNAGCGTVLVLTGYGATEAEECARRSDYVARDIYDAWKHIRHTIERRTYGS